MDGKEGKKRAFFTTTYVDQNFRKWCITNGLRRQLFADPLSYRRKSRKRWEPVYLETPRGPTLVRHPATLPATISGIPRPGKW
jgi:hypothetical protein